MKFVHKILNAHITCTTLLFLFGLNSKISDHLASFEDVFKTIPVKVILLQPPKQKVFIYKEVVLRAWYKVTVDETMLAEDKQSMEEARIALMDFIKTNKIQTENLILAGFSQGGALALYTACLADFKFHSVLGLCTYLPFHLLVNTVQKQNVVMLNTKNDPVFPLSAVQILIRIFNSLHGNVFHFVCEGNHHIYFDRLGFLVNAILDGEIFQNPVPYSIEIY